MKWPLFAFFMSATALLAKPQALMITPGEQVVSRNFNNESDVDEK